MTKFKFWASTKKSKSPLKKGLVLLGLIEHPIGYSKMLLLENKFCFDLYIGNSMTC